MKSILERCSEELEEFQKHQVAMVNDTLIEIFSKIKDKGPIKGFNWGYITADVNIEIEYNQKKDDTLPETGNFLLSDILTSFEEGVFNMSYYDSNQKQHFFNINFEKKSLKEIKDILEVLELMMKTFGDPNGSEYEELLRSELKFPGKEKKIKKKNRKEF